MRDLSRAQLPGLTGILGLALLVTGCEDRVIEIPGCEDVCSPGQSLCSGENSIQTCELKDCLVWSEPVACPGGVACADDRCQTPCQPECEPGEVRCYNRGVQTCLVPEQPGGCAGWSRVEPCADDHQCDGGACRPSCVDECGEADRRCSEGGTGYQGCGQHDEDGCREWSPVVDCNPGEVCQGAGICESPCNHECVSGSSQCVDGGVQRCQEVDGCLLWSEPEPCAGGLICSRGRCEPFCRDECAAGSRRCVGTSVIRCAKQDHCLVWGEPEACPAGENCFEGECRPCQDECGLGTSRCQVDGLQICQEDQGCARWGTLLGDRFTVGLAQPCPEGTVCETDRCQEGPCSDQCREGELQCAQQGQGYRRCGNFDAVSCLEWSETIPCPQGQVCSAGRCSDRCEHECAEGATRCPREGGDSLSRCTADATGCRRWSPAQLCPEEQRCSGGSCRSCAAIPEVPDGVDNDCDGLVDEAPAGTLPGRCILLGPLQPSTTEHLPSPRVLGRVYAQGMTEAAGPHPAVRAELGWGPTGSDPSGDGAGWNWRAANPVQPCADCGEEDEYAQRLVLDARGSYAVAYRFSVDGGTSWRYCDGDGSAGGYSPQQAGRLVVGPGVSWSSLHWPEDTVQGVLGRSLSYYGWVYQPGVTDPEGQGAGVRAEVGHGPDGSDPREEPERWTWLTAIYHGDVGIGGHDDEYLGEFMIEGRPGTFDVAFRFSLDDGASWVYADKNGSHDGYDPAQSGDLIVSAPQNPVTVTWAGNWGVNFSREQDCALARTEISEPLYVDPWVRDEARCRQVVAEVYVRGLSDDPGGDPARVLGQVMRTPLLAGDELGEPEFLPLRYARSFRNNYEFRWDLPAGDLADPALAAASWRLYFRFSGDGGQTWFQIGQGDGPMGGAARTLTHRLAP